MNIFWIVVVLHNAVYYTIRFEKTSEYVIAKDEKKAYNAKRKILTLFIFYSYLYGKLRGQYQYSPPKNDPDDDRADFGCGNCRGFSFA